MEQVKQYEYVDLGLPSGLKWAKCNVGAETETDYGDYFMWGSTTPNTNTTCDWEHSPFNNGASDYDEEYFTTHKSEWLDNNGNLKPEFDAARAIMGGDWRMPTKDEIQELIDNTTNEWVEDYNGSGVNGMKFTSKTNGKSIFFPASGGAYGTGVYNRGSYGYFWSSSLHPSDSYYGLYLLFSSSGIVPQNDIYRFYGFCVRSVLRNN